MSSSSRPQSFNRIKTIVDIRNAKNSLTDRLLAVTANNPEGSLAVQRQVSALKLKQSVMNVMLVQMMKSSSRHISVKPSIRQIALSVAKEVPTPPPEPTSPLEPTVTPVTKFTKERPAPHEPLPPEMNPLNFDEIARPQPKVVPVEHIHEPSLVTPKLIDAADHVDEIRQAVIRLVAEGEVVTALDPDSNVAYDHQGDLKFYTDDNLQKRLELRYHPLLCRMTRVFWLTMAKPDAQKMEFDDYQRLFLRIHKVLIELFDMTESKIMIADDWKRDVANHSDLEYEMFHLSLFELIDIWCDSLDADDYVNLLYLILNGITHHQSGSFRLRRLEDVAYIDVSEEANNLSSPLITNFLDSVEKAQNKKLKALREAEELKLLEASMKAAKVDDVPTAVESVVIVDNTADTTDIIANDDPLASQEMQARLFGNRSSIHDEPLAKTMHTKLKIVTPNQAGTLYHASHTESAGYDPHMDLSMSDASRRQTKRPAQTPRGGSGRLSTSSRSGSTSYRKASAALDRRPTSGGHTNPGDEPISEELGDGSLAETTERPRSKSSARHRLSTLKAGTKLLGRPNVSNSPLHESSSTDDTIEECVDDAFPEDGSTSEWSDELATARSTAGRGNAISQRPDADTQRVCVHDPSAMSTGDDEEEERASGGLDGWGTVGLTVGSDRNSAELSFDSTTDIHRRRSSGLKSPPLTTATDSESTLLLDTLAKGVAPSKQQSFTRDIDPAHFRPKDMLTATTDGSAFAVKSLGTIVRNGLLSRSPRYIGAAAEDGAHLDWSNLGIGGARILPINGKVHRLGGRPAAPAPTMEGFVIASQSLHPPRIHTAPDNARPSPRVQDRAPAAKFDHVVGASPIARVGSGRRNFISRGQHVAKKANEAASQLVHALASESFRMKPVQPKIPATSPTANTEGAKPSPLDVGPPPRSVKPTPPTLYKIGMKRALPGSPGDGLEPRGAGLTRPSRPTLVSAEPTPLTHLSDDAKKNEMLFRVTALGSPAAKPAFAVAADTNLQALVRQPTRGFHDVFKVTGLQARRLNSMKEVDPAHLFSVRQDAIRLVTEGIVEVDAEDAASYERQGDLAYYSEESLQQRLALRDDPLLRRLTRTFWSLTNTNFDATMNADGYSDIMIRVHKILNEYFDTASTLHMIEEDWVSDTQGSNALSYEAFHLSMYELVGTSQVGIWRELDNFDADLWCDSVKYVSLLYLLLTGITNVENQHLFFKEIQGGGFTLRSHCIE
ncbi:hypothetical protein ACHHYP_03098 [Achlya hypogyna]|uniref:Uncharacterized protein n=1 Tax=Achlya hypogyna TaxID=1202772 RepID=A0A1V9Z4J1_ACHHY|nr:hypothetical protein ACHHYP_03098 [Achlya hypogyna]